MGFLFFIFFDGGLKISKSTPLGQMVVFLMFHSFKSSTTDFVGIKIVLALL